MHHPGEMNSERHYFALIGDIIDSRHEQDRYDVQKKLQSILSSVNAENAAHIAADFLITLGDEFQGLLFAEKGADPIFVADRIIDEMFPVRIRIAIGFGGMATQIRREAAIGADGEAFYRARHGMNLLRKAENRGRAYSRILLDAGGTIGSVEDFGITDANNMGAAMAPAAFKTIKTHLSDYSRRVEDYDRIITGDLGIFGSDMLYELLRGEGIEIADRHEDCGKLMFSPEQNVNCGASGCGCAATVMSSWFLPKIESGEIRRVLFLATGALMSPVSSLQGESIPSIAHAVVIEHID